MKFTIEIDLPEPIVEIGKVYHVGGPEFFEVFILVDRIQVSANGRWSVSYLVGKEEPTLDVLPDRRRARVSGIIQQGWRPTSSGEREVIQPGTRWDTDGQWNFEPAEWTGPFAAEVPGLI